MFINDMHLYFGECDCDLYADYATAHTSGKSRTEVETKLQMREIMIKLKYRK